MVQVRKSFISGAIAIVAMIFVANVPASAKSQTVPKGSYKGYGTVKGERVRCNASYRGRRVSVNCRSSSGKGSRSSCRLRGNSCAFRSGKYRGRLTVSRVSARSHNLTIRINGEGTSRLRMRRRR